jgi:hypothetical protein
LGVKKQSRKIKVVNNCKKVFHRNNRSKTIKYRDFAGFSTVSTEFSTGQRIKIEKNLTIFVAIGRGQFLSLFFYYKINFIHLET